jgi:predicted O-methyltransferase YrrM
MSFLKNLWYVIRSGAPVSIIWSFILTRLRRTKIEENKPVMDALRCLAREGSFTQDWFSWNVPYWEYYYTRGKHIRGDAQEILEVGSFEGLSSCYIFQAFPQSRLTCVDTWEGSDEHAGTAGIRQSEANFDTNTAKFTQRLIKNKETSRSFFGRTEPKATYDLIYIDGSHRCEDVLFDGLCAYDHLKVGGTLIFDDYLWDFYPDFSRNPANAINHFAKLMSTRMEVKMAYHQVIMVKLG